MLIKHLWQKWVFVFGSNLAGRHGAGAALDARRFWGAKLGVGAGPTGQAYAIPTKDESLNVLPLERIAEQVEDFLKYASSHPDITFMVTRIGCGLAGYTDEQIAPLFGGASENVLLPGLWRQSAPRVIVAGSRSFEDYDLMCERLDHLLSRLESPVIISGGARGADRLAIEYARERGFECEVYPALWDRHGKAAGFLRNRVMAWAGTHLVAFHKENSPGTEHMIKYARENGLAVRRVAVDEPKSSPHTGFTWKHP